MEKRIPLPFPPSYCLSCKKRAQRKNATPLSIEKEREESKKDFFLFWIFYSLSPVFCFLGGIPPPPSPLSRSPFLFSRENIRAVKGAGTR